MTSIPPERFRPRLFHAAILAPVVALIVGSLSPAGRALGARALHNPHVLLLVASPWLLGAFILANDRKSRLKLWVVPLLLSLLAPALVVFGNFRIALDWPPTQGSLLLISSLMINVILVWWFTFYLRGMCPKCCPECENWSMISLRSFSGSDKRTQNTLWCASCGALYWRTQEGGLQKERRLIWLDIPQREVNMNGTKESKAFDTSTRIIAPVVRSRGNAMATASGGSPPDTSELAVLGSEDQGGSDL